MSDVFAGRYQRLRTLGSGGMGDVWLARDLELGRLVAIKRLRDAGGDPTLVDRMLREARLAARLRHPNVVVIFDVLRDMDRPVLVMDYVDGETLDQRIRRERRLASADAATLIAQVASALAAAHELGIVHRDVKPANILIDRRDRAHLADFGIARALEDTALTGTGQLLGTIQFMAPEVANGGLATPASDVWSLGATLFAAVEGHAPFADTADAQPVTVLYRMISSPVPGAPNAGAYSTLIADMLAHDPSRRPSAEQVARRLEPSSVGPVTSASPPTVRVPVPTADAATTVTDRPSWPHPLPTTPRKPLGRRRLAWSVALVIALIAAVVVAITLTRSDGGTPAAGGGSTSPTTSSKIITTTSSTTVQTSVSTEETPPPLSEGSAHGIVPQLPIPSPAQTSIRPEGHVGSFSLATGDGIGFCNYAENRAFTGFVINPPEAALRTAWAHTSAGQFVQFDEVLQGFDKSWHTLRTLSRSTQVGQTLTALPRLAQFPISSSWTGRYATFRVIEKLTWLRPTDNVAEGSVTAPIGPCAATQ